MAIVAEELNVQNKIINENIKTNLLIQKKEYDGLIRRLGTNIQEALLKIKSDLKYETRDSVDGLEQRLNGRQTDLSEELAAVKDKWVKDFANLKHVFGRNIDESAKETSKKLGKLLDDTILAMEEQINDHVVTKVSKLDSQLKEVAHVDVKLEKHIEYVKDSFEKLTGTQEDHLSLF
jgi:DNA anti-recombination protein RmuC